MLTYDGSILELVENKYEIAKEAQHAALYTTGNGYYGVRGSFEEFGSINVQGAFIRGLIDEIIEVPKIFVDNIYMRKYYINELEAKKFEYQDSCINFADFLTIRFEIGGKTFYPWDGKVLSWLRYIDTKDGSLVREVLWDDGNNHISKITFKRFASFKDNHVFVIKAQVEKINHDLDVKVLSGIDTFIKTNGQKKSKLVKQNYENGIQQYLFNVGKKYKFEVAVGIKNTFINCQTKQIEFSHKEGMYFEEVIGKPNSKVVGVEKIVYSNATMDYKVTTDLLIENRKHLQNNKTYDFYYNEHLEVYQAEIDNMAIKLENESDDALLRYANYQTLISLDRYDRVHSVTAKNLTGEKYNQFIWWDAEIYQFPIYLMTNPKAAKNILLYRYDRLEESKKNARLEGLEGAKFAFCSSVKGDEKVWSYARHPFLQIHINSDIAYAILNYYHTTKDFDFIRDYGYEMLVEISKYFVSRVTYNQKEDIYELLNVTGTDEHHPYINNNSYTNLMVKELLKETVSFRKLLGDAKSEASLFEKFLEISNKLKFEVSKDGYIAQFDGYFNLNPELEVTGHGAAKNFQMKESGLYHESQVIKQPDVMMLFTYINLDLPKEANYQKNWAYYEAKCEASSSLTYPAHAIAAIDNKEYDKFYQYWYKSASIDIIDLHNEAYAGLHAACMAGAWYSIYRGLFGFKAKLEYLSLDPKYFERFGQTEINFFYQDFKVKAILKKGTLEIHSNGTFNLEFNGSIIKHENLTIVNF